MPDYQFLHETTGHPAPVRRTVTAVCHRHAESARDLLCIQYPRRSTPLVFGTDRGQHQAAVLVVTGCRWPAGADMVELNRH